MQNWPKNVDYDVAILEYHAKRNEGIQELARRLSQAQSPIPLVVLTSIDRPHERLEGLEHTAFLPKPCRQAAVSGLLANIFDKKMEQSPTSVRSRAIVSLADTNPLRILVAEDNPVNQKVALGILGKLGYRPDIVGNGVEAVEAVKRQDYDVIFMDRHMPIMDGIVATRTIRVNCQGSRQPFIVALTAAALDEEKRHCHDAGMDGFLSKPVVVDELIETLRRASSTIVDDSGQRSQLDETTPIAPKDEALWSKLDELFDNFGQEMLLELIELFQANAADLLDKMQIAGQAGDLYTLAGAAHQLKSTSATIGAVDLAEFCAKIERGGKTGSIDNPSAHVRLCADRVFFVNASIQQYLQNYEAQA